MTFWEAVDTTFQRLTDDEAGDEHDDERPATLAVVQSIPDDLSALLDDLGPSAFTLDNASQLYHRLQSLGRRVGRTLSGYLHLATLLGSLDDISALEHVRKLPVVGRPRVALGRVREPASDSGNPPTLSEAGSGKQPLLAGFANALGRAPKQSRSKVSPSGRVSPTPTTLPDSPLDPPGELTDEVLARSVAAVQALREAARTQPDQHLPGLAAALHEHALLLARVDRLDEALRLAQDAVAIRQHLAKHDPARHLGELATALRTCGGQLGALGRHGEAVQTVEDAVAVRRHLANEDPARHLPLLAATLDDLARELRAAGQPDVALAAVEDAVTIRRHLAACLAERFLPDLAATLHDLGQGLGAAGRHTEALATVEEAVAIRRGLAEQAPDRYRPHLAASLQALSIGLGALGQAPESLAAGEEATQLYQDLAHRAPGPHLDGFATSVENLAISLSAMGRHAEGRAASENAVVLRRLAEHAPPDDVVGLLSVPVAGRVARCWCSCHTTHAPAAELPPVDTTAITGPTPIVR